MIFFVKSTTRENIRDQDQFDKIKSSLQLLEVPNELVQAGIGLSK